MLEVSIQKRLEGFTLDVELCVGAGITVLFGPSGAGKSMTLACIAGLVTPDAGRIVINGSVVFDDRARINLPPQRRRVGYVMQDYLLFPHLTVAQNIAYGLVGRPRREKQAAVQEMVALMDLGGLEGRRPHELSGGQQQRVALARALVTRPQVLLLDEPFSALDGPIRARLRRDLLRIQRDFDLPVLFVTHDLAEAYLLADRIAVVEKGRILQVGTPEEVVYRPRDRRVAEVTGGTNFFVGQVVGHDAQGLVVRVGQVELITPPAPVQIGDWVELCIRAERIMLIRKDVPVGPRENEVRGRIVEELSDGLNHVLFFRLDDDQRLRRGAYDLEIALPAYVYERLGVGRDKRWSATIKREAIHVLGRRVQKSSHELL